ncbi:MAG: hypothetical protein WCJ87_07550 [Burkholderiales bacterium]
MTTLSFPGGLMLPVIAVKVPARGAPKPALSLCISPPPVNDRFSVAAADFGVFVALWKTRVQSAVVAPT